VSAHHELARPIQEAIRSLPLELWRAADGLAWGAARQPPNRLKSGGAVGHLKPITLDDLARRYGYFLNHFENDLALTMRPQSKSSRLVMAEVLIEAGLSLIAETEAAASMTRLKNYHALEIGRTFVDINGKWWIVLPASETKERRPDERPVDAVLKPAIESYLATFRPILQARGSHRLLCGVRK
jgi:hypothetical protein